MNRCTRRSSWVAATKGAQTCCSGVSRPARSRELTQAVWYALAAVLTRKRCVLLSPLFEAVRLRARRRSTGPAPARRFCRRAYVARTVAAARVPACLALLLARGATRRTALACATDRHAVRVGHSRASHRQRPLRPVRRYPPLRGPSSRWPGARLVLRLCGAALRAAPPAYPPLARARSAPAHPCSAARCTRPVARTATPVRPILTDRQLTQAGRSAERSAGAGASVVLAAAVASSGLGNQARRPRADGRTNGRCRTQDGRRGPQRRRKGCVRSSSLCGCYVGSSCAAPQCPRASALSAGAAPAARWFGGSSAASAARSSGAAPWLDGSHVGSTSLRAAFLTSGQRQPVRFGADAPLSLCSVRCACYAVLCGGAVRDAARLSRHHS